MKILTALKNRALRIPLLIKIIALAVIVGLTVFGVSRLRSDQPTQTQYQTSQVEKGNLVISTSVSGQVLAANSASVTTNATGVVSSVLVENGQTVKAGTPIAKIDLDLVAQQKYAQASATYQSAKTSLASANTALYTLRATMLGKWDTFKELSESEEYKDSNSTNRNLPEFYIPQDEWLAAEANYKQQQAVIAQAQTSLNSAWLSLQQTSPTISAPINGKVTGLSLQKGSVISSTSDSSDTTTTQKIASITTEALPLISISLTETDVAKIAIGNKVTITVDALADKTFTGQIVSVDTTGSVASNVTSYPAVIKLDTEADGLLSNMSVQANIITATKNNVLLVPSSAVQKQNDQSFVRVLQNGEPQLVSVETGLSSTTQTEIVSGLNEGDTIVISTPAMTTPQSGGTQTISPFSTFGGGGGGTRNAVRIGG